ncbi:membrane protein [Vibrio inusitatus NBRC 102082]|uniref:Membrane protein n=1 Tax=Vibrio inusitatus NBRC 102082 TaxID=1219070 RepID=A0A4Y3HW40_9VIBR|nr:isoprenylcysteine carboxylmethyltransferase family protein [Vibrio inusitatus]GEA51389.1 membrane protein [Vibrio inusitatus NBRC 102082]
MLNNKIPPPLVMLICAGLGGFFDGFAFTSQPLAWLLGLAFLVTGVWLAVVSVVSFKQAKTTINPLDPSQATLLVSHGVFRYSRNPMYVSLTLLLVAWSCLLLSALALAFCLVFVLYITQFQIKPEEKVLKSKFGKPYEEYCRKVRRWL